MFFHREICRSTWKTHTWDWFPVLKNWCFWTLVLEKTLKSPLDSKEIQPINPKGNQSWIFTGKTDAKAATPILWPSDVKNWLFEKDPDAVKDWGQEEKGMTGWDGWTASPIRWTWVWASSGSWWWIGKPGVLQFKGSQRIVHNWATELNSWPFTRVLQVDPPLSIWGLTTFILKNWNEHCPLWQDRWVTLHLLSFHGQVLVGLHAWGLLTELTKLPCEERVPITLLPCLYWDLIYRQSNAQILSVLFDEFWQL